jgi:hypothetical protein
MKLGAQGDEKDRVMEKQGGLIRWCPRKKKHVTLLHNKIIWKRRLGIELINKTKKRKKKGAK